MVSYVELYRKGRICMDYEVINRWIIPIMWGMVALSLALFIVAIVVIHRFDKKITKGSETAFKKEMYYWLDVPYTIFIVLISLFPLMGMLGTVSALLTLDISGATEALKSNFFKALDTTGMGLIWAIIFKFANAFLQPHIEERIAKAKKLLEKGEENEQTRNNP